MENAKKFKFDKTCIENKPKSVYADFIPNARKTYPVKKYFPCVNLDQLNVKQRKVDDIIESHYSKEEPNPIRLIVCGVGGTGLYKYI